MRRHLSCLLALALAACAEFPELDAAVGPEALRAPYPDLVPLTGLRLAAELPPPDFTADLAARAAALRARAEILRQAL